MKKLLLVVLASISIMNTASCDQSLNSAVIASVNDQQTQKELSEKLRDYRVTGAAFCVDPNVAFIYDNQNPSFVMTFINSKGEIKTRGYQASINSIGIKFEFAIKLNLIMFVNTDLNFENSTKELQLGTGIDLSFGLITLTYAPFTNAAGGILIAGLPVGPSISPLSLVVSGSLKPLL